MECLKGGRFVGYRAGSASSGAYYFLEHVFGAIDEDLGCARYGGCDVQFVSVIPWPDSENRGDS